MHKSHKDLLRNGLTVVTVEAPQLHSAVLATYVRAGSRHETSVNNGVSHFLEHVFFRGCRRFPEGRRLNMRVEDAGGSLNGVTARDHGYYFTPLHASRLEVGLETLGAMLSEPLYKELDLEREVILEEMLDEVDEDGRDIDVDNVSKQAVFGEHPLALKIAGTTDTVRGMTREMLETHHQRFYVAKNLVLVVAGPVRRDEVLALADRHFGGFAPGARALEAPPAPWPAAPRLVEVRHDETQTELRLSFPAPPESDPEFPALMVLRRILDDGLSTRLQVNVVERKGLAYSIQAGFDTFVDAGTLEVDVACAHAKVPAAAEEVLRTLAELANAPVDDDELVRAKVRYRIGFDFMEDSPSDLAGWYGGTELFRPADSFEARIAQVDAVTAEDVQRAARRVLRKSGLVATVIGRLDRTTRRVLTRLVHEGGELPA
jgi:predicted Zn-dependent peptidase